MADKKPWYLRPRSAYGETPEVPEWHRRPEEERTYRELNARRARLLNAVTDAREAVVVARDEGAPAEEIAALEAEHARLKNAADAELDILNPAVMDAAAPLQRRRLALKEAWRARGGWNVRTRDFPREAFPAELGVTPRIAESPDPWMTRRDIAWARRAHLMAAVGPELVRIAQAGRLVPAATPAETARQERIIRRIGVPDLEDAEDTATGAGAVAAGAGVAGGKRTGATSPRGPSKRGGGGPPGAGSYSPS